MNLSVNNLEQSYNFIYDIFNDVTSAIFMVDIYGNIFKYNRSFQRLFSINKLTEKSYGKVLNCEYLINENKKCGTTSKCTKCILKNSILKAFRTGINSNDQLLERNFYIDGMLVKKFFKFNTKLVEYDNNHLVMIILDDLTDFKINNIELTQKNEILERFNNKIKTQISLAKNIYDCILPDKFPNVKNIEFYAKYKTFEEIGGDLYDVIKLDTNRVGIFIGDVSGYGISAAMVTSMIRTLIATNKALLKSPSELMKYLNKKIIYISEDMYLTAFYGIYNCKTNKFNYIRCGHPNPLLVRNNSFNKITGASNPILGMFQDTDFESDTILLEKSDKIIFYTDGLINTQKYKEPDYENYLKDLISKNSSSTISHLVDCLYYNTINSSNKETLNDDICILGMEIKL